MIANETKQKKATHTTFGNKKTAEFVNVIKKAHLRTVNICTEILKMRCKK